MRKAYLFLLFVILLWAATPLLVTELARTLPTFEITFLATGFAVLAFAVLISARGSWPRFRTYRRRDVLVMTLMGASGIFPYTTLYYLAFALAPGAAGEINIINYIWPVWILILSPLLLAEPLTGRKLLGIFLSFCGVYVIVSGGRFIRFDPALWPAYASAGCGAFFWGLFSVLGKRKHFELLSAMLIYNLAAWACFGVLCFATVRFVSPGAKEWLLLACLGGLVNGAGYFFWLLSLRLGDTAKISSAVYLTPFVALLYLSVFGRGTITWVQLTALGLILAGPLIQKTAAPAAVDRR
jgi:drug/metabolite transporter (DMT)-like permease